MKIDNIEINYKTIGDGKNIILLHGWGSSIEIFNELITHLKDRYCVWAIDFPGFGNSEEPKRVYGVIDYMACLRLFIRENKIEDPIILGHSFGGRVAIKYANYYDIDRLILVDSAGIKKRSVRYYYKVFLYKLLKKLGINKDMGSEDYKNASDMMKKILIKVVNEDLKKEIRNIKCETLIIWGKNDLITKSSMGKKMSKLIDNSGLVIIPNAGHFSFIDNKSYFNLVLDSFLASGNR